MAATGGESKQVSIHVREDSDSELQALFDISLKGGLRPLQGCVLFVSFLRPFMSFCVLFALFASYLRPFMSLVSFCVHLCPLRSLRPFFATFLRSFAAFLRPFVSFLRPFVSLCVFLYPFASICVLLCSFCVLLCPLRFAAIASLLCHLFTFFGCLFASFLRPICVLWCPSKILFYVFLFCRPVSYTCSSFFNKA